MTHNSGINSLNTSLRRTVKIMIMIIMLIFIVFNSMVMAQQSQCNGVVVMNLTMVGQVWCTPHIYQGDYNGQPVGNYPVYYGPSNASQYWSLAGISSNQPILELVPPQTGSAGAMFWSGHYSGGPVTIMLVGTYTTGTVGSVADGFEFYLFIKPSGWSTTNPASNYSIPYYELNSGEPNSYPVEGSVIFPYAMPGTEYIVVQWNPWWSYGYQYGPLNGGDWNVWIGVGNGNSTPGITDVIDGVGSGAFEPNPGDLIMVEVTYNPSTNTISGYAEDLNTGQVASLSYSLNGNFTPPSPGQYTFGIAGNTGGWYANWGVMAVGEEGITYTPITISTNYTVTFIEEGLPTGGAPWSVTVNGTTKTSTTNEITFTLPAGTYTFSASTNVTGYEVLNSTGTFTVSGNETLNILFASTNESSSFKIYSEYIEYFFTGFNEPNVFYVQAPNIDNSQPISVTGYITLNNESVSFTYNPSIGMWESNTIDMGQLPPGKGYLVVIAKYPSGQILTNNYTVTVVQSPALIVNILLLTHYAVLSASELYPLITNKTLYNTEASFEYKIIYSRVGLYNNTFLIVSNVDVKWNETHKEIEASYLSGEYEFGGFNIYVQFDFNSTGIVDISGKYHLFTFHGEVLSYPIDIKAVVGASGVLYVNYSNYSIELQSFSVFNDLSAAASFIIPTPWTWTIPVVNIKVGFIPVVSVAFSNTIYFTFTPTNNPQQEFLGLPVALSINGHALYPLE
ncbi:hypothetical protein [Vulcanisaeta distributa]|uniref:hypothetical protein n=1 Tax=Vulcanisaeta distributa TaxID=164451 RepID=UPI000A5BAC27|nr:hypothetical protein [Vulcanisaeta distributa]